MKKIILILMGFALLFTSCDSDESITPSPDFSDVTWFSSIPLNTTGNTTINSQNATVISIFDLSQGDISHEWTISDGAHFLRPGYNNPRNASAPADATPFIDETKGLSTTDKKVFIFFPAPGDYTITLKNTFKEMVTYKGEIPIDAVQVGDEWVFEQVFNIEVN